ncbi:MAG: DGQHR domain-containing protein [Methyloprofundus sp.]|nr:DGQHR domain-containing protein [Methyloprofundus sp.]
MATFSIDGLKVNYNDTTFYVAVINADKLFKISEVSRAEENPEVGYQRLLGQSRANKIAAYINDGNVIPGALILSATKKDIIKFKDNKLTLSDEPRGFLVIDGQHRLYGAHQSSKNIPIPVCIFDGLSKEEEVRYFLDINGTQRGVPKTLQLELTKFTAEPESKEDILMTLFGELDENIKSPLNGKLTRTRTITGKLSHVPFQNALMPLIEKAPLYSLKPQQKIELLINFLSSVEDILIEEYGNASKLTNAAFFQALMMVFEDACSSALQKHGNYRKDSFLDVLKDISEISLEEHSGTNKKAIKDLSIKLRDKISKQPNINPEDLF